MAVSDWKEGDVALCRFPNVAAALGIGPKAELEVKAVAKHDCGTLLVFEINGVFRVSYSKMWDHPEKPAKRGIPRSTYLISRDRPHQQLGLFVPWNGDPVPFRH